VCASRQRRQRRGLLSGMTERHFRDIVTQASAGGIEVVSTTANPTTHGNDVQNSGVYDVGGMGIRIGVRCRRPIRSRIFPTTFTSAITLLRAIGG
jgi:hypothetical protein